MSRSKIIYLGIKGSVIAMDSATGQPIWTVHLKGSDFVNLVLDGNNLYATTQGEIFCLDPLTGDGRWHNKLVGFGCGLVSIAGGGDSSPFAPLAGGNATPGGRSLHCLRQPLDLAGSLKGAGGELRSSVRR
jgi:outer membrane protein assembly factor BamB